MFEIASLAAMAGKKQKHAMSARFKAGYLNDNVDLNDINDIPGNNPIRYASEHNGKCAHT
ncbi:hypothetical protein GCM10009411_24990 [Shewanella litoralis]|uniref:Uncharacterized protein n=1 Tax=Shewanella litoralis TaxID=2282700 RepID=A0ABQ2RDR3_9GAMM|nr:hypothetical protein GCM10009411_24990 [Shewanella litoralis]